MSIEEITISKQLPARVADKAIDLLVYQANWVSHTMDTGIGWTTMVWFPEGRGHGAAEIHADALDARGVVTAVAPRFSEFWAAVDAVKLDPELGRGVE